MLSGVVIIFALDGIFDFARECKIIEPNNKQTSWNVRLQETEIQLIVKKNKKDMRFRKICEGSWGSILKLIGNGGIAQLLINS